MPAATFWGGWGCSCEDDGGGGGGEDEEAVVGRRVMAGLAWGRGKRRGGRGGMGICSDIGT